MGSQESIGHNPIEFGPRNDIIRNCEIYSSAEGQEFQKYIVQHDGSDQFQNEYHQRINNSNTDFVNVYYAGPISTLATCSNRIKYEVITERIPYRMNSITSLQPKNALAILKVALRGFKNLYKKYGFFVIKESMIGIDCRHRIKIWLNQNFALNRPEIDQQFINTQEREMVQYIIDILNSKVHHRQVWYDLIALNEQKNPHSFDDALSLLNYLSSRQIKITQKLPYDQNKRNDQLINIQETKKKNIEIMMNLNSDKIAKSSSNQIVYRIPQVVFINNQYYPINNPIIPKFDLKETKTIAKVNQIVNNKKVQQRLISLNNSEQIKSNQNPSISLQDIVDNKLSENIQYKIKIHEIQDEDEYHEDKNNMQISLSNQIESKNIQYKFIFQNNLRNSCQIPQHHLQNLKTAVNASLIDTRQIKHQSPFISESKQYNTISQKKISSFTYKEMRKILLDQLSL